MPAIEGLLADADGNVWTADHLAAGDTVPTWSVFSPEGRWLGTVTTPPGLKVTQVGRDFVLGTFRDAMDVEYVRMHRIVKPAR